jgi:hypothetical protein
MPDERKSDRYGLRPDTSGWTVFELWTGEPATIASVRQTGLSEDDAKHTAALLNRRAKDGDSSMRR